MEIVAKIDYAGVYLVKNIFDVADDKATTPTSGKGTNYRFLHLDIVADGIEGCDI